MTAGEAKNLTFGSPLMNLERIVMEDTNVLILLDGGWEYQGTWWAPQIGEPGKLLKRDLIVFFGKKYGEGTAGTCVTVPLPMGQVKT